MSNKHYNTFELYNIGRQDSPRIAVLKNQYNIIASRLNLSLLKGHHEGHHELVEQLYQLRKQLKESEQGI